MTLPEPERGELAHRYWEESKELGATLKRVVDCADRLLDCDLNRVDQIRWPLGGFEHIQELEIAIRRARELQAELERPGRPAGSPGEPDAARAP